MGDIDDSHFSVMYGDNGRATLTSITVVSTFPEKPYGAAA